MDAGEKAGVITWIFSRTEQKNRILSFFFKHILCFITLHYTSLCIERMVRALLAAVFESSVCMTESSCWEQTISVYEFIELFNILCSSDPHLARQDIWKKEVQEKWQKYWLADEGLTNNESYLGQGLPKRSLRIRACGQLVKSGSCRTERDRWIWNISFVVYSWLLLGVSS